MSKCGAVIKRELLSYFVSPAAYVAFAGFTLLGAFFFFNLLGSFNHALHEFASLPFRTGAEPPNLNQWVIEGYYQTLIVMLIFIVPLLTMRLFSEEHRHNTFELLFTSPLSPGALVFGKFLALISVVSVMVTAALSFPALLYAFGNPEFWPAVVGASAVYLSAIAFCAVGLAIATGSSSQLTAGVATLICLLLLYMLHVPATDLQGTAADVLRSVSPMWQARELVQGVVSLESVSYFLSLSLFSIYCAVKICQYQRVH